MNRRIFKKITSHKYIYPTKRIQNIIRHIDESGDTIMCYKKNYDKYWSFILKRIEIKNKLFHKYFVTRKYLMKVPSQTERLKQLHRMVTIRRTIKTEKLQNNKKRYGFAPISNFFRISFTAHHHSIGNISCGSYRHDHH